VRWFVCRYVEQTDIHLPQTSVREALAFSAALRLPTTVDAPRRAAFVGEVLSLAELDRIGGAFVGVPGVSGLSSADRKRLTLAVELVANPSILFMDEPTSGLDARAAGVVMRAVRNTVDSGRTVVCTIHQPNTDIFLAFDELLLLKPGGLAAYFGPLGNDANMLLAYLHAIPGVPRIRPNHNPANFMLEVASLSSEAALGLDLAAHYRDSPLAAAMRAAVARGAAPAPGAAPLEMAELHVASWGVQFRENLGRFWRQYCRAPEYNLTRALVTLGVAFVFGSLFWRQGDKVTTPGGVLNVTGLIFSSVLFIGITNCLTIQHLIATQRTVFYR
jgi:energy-coupling factor transporter ATP-binding protein EcfA2